MADTGDKRHLSDREIKIGADRLKILHEGLAQQMLVPTKIHFDNSNNDFRFVGVVGSWSEWLEVHKMQKTSEDMWETTLDLPEGDHELKFIVDGTWRLSDLYSRVDDGVGTTGERRCL